MRCAGRTNPTRAASGAMDAHAAARWGPDQISLKGEFPAGDVRRTERSAVKEKRGAAEHQGGVRSAGHADPPGGVAPHSERVSPVRYPERYFQSIAMTFEFLQIFFENVTRHSTKPSCTRSL
jgi:hypothetical protein